MSLIDGTLSLAAAPRRGSLRLFVVPPPPLGFYLISPSEFERFSLSARNVTEPLCRLEVSRLQDTSCLRWDGCRGHGGFATATPLYPHPMAPAPAVTSPPPPPRFLPATARRRRRSCRRRTAPTSRAAPRADAPPPTVTVSDHPIPAVHTASPPPPRALHRGWPRVLAAPLPALPSPWLPRVPRGTPGRLLARPHRLPQQQHGEPAGHHRRHHRGGSEGFSGVSGGGGKNGVTGAHSHCRQHRGAATMAPCPALAASHPVLPQVLGRSGEEPEERQRGRSPARGDPHQVRCVRGRWSPGWARGVGGRWPPVARCGRGSGCNPWGTMGFGAGTPMQCPGIPIHHREDGAGVPGACRGRGGSVSQPPPGPLLRVCITHRHRQPLQPISVLGFPGRVTRLDPHPAPPPHIT